MIDFEVDVSECDVDTGVCYVICYSSGAIKAGRTAENLRGDL